MTTVAESDLFTSADRVKDKVVIITGAAGGLGKSAALFFAKYGAKVAIGDLDLEGAEGIVAEIKSSGGDAIAQKCDVTSWEQQLSLFQFTIRTYNRIDIVVPNAGVSELGRFAAPRVTAVDGIPTKPDLKTLEIDLIGVLYSARLALYYLLENQNQSPDSLKAIIFIGSMSSIQSIPMAPLYSTSKHGLIGLMGSLYGQFKDEIRFGIVCPFFADTPIVPTAIKLFMAGIPLTPISRIGATILKAATDTDPKSNGAVYTLPDHGDTFRVDRGQLSLDAGVYKLLNDRVAATFSTVSTVGYYAAILKDVIKIVLPKILPLLFSVVIGFFAWKNAGIIRGYIDTF